MQNSGPKRVSRLLKSVWFLIAGLLLLGHTPGLAEPYLRVSKNGVVYYHFNSREPAQPRPEETTSPPDPGQLIPETAAAAPAGHPPAAQANPPATARYLIRFLTKLGFYDTPVVPPFDIGPQWLEPHAEVPATPDPQFMLPEVLANLPKQASALPPALGRMQPGPGRLKLSNSLGYCFPVARTFTFRDTWDDPRSGGRLHRAVDIFAQEGTEVYAITAGVVQTLATLPGAGITLILRGHDGRGYGYMHLLGYAPGLVEGKVVRAGELIGYVGATGTQNCAAHLHLQVYADHNLSRDSLLNPYDFLVQLCHGIGVTDVNQPRIARLKGTDLNQPKGARLKVTDVNQSKLVRFKELPLNLKEPSIKVKWTQVRPTWVKSLDARRDQLTTKSGSILVIKNF